MGKLLKFHLETIEMEIGPIYANSVTVGNSHITRTPPAQSGPVEVTLHGAVLTWILKDIGVELLKEFVELMECEKGIDGA